MPVTVVFVLFAVIVIAGAVLVLAGRWDPGMAPTDRPGPPELPDASWDAADVRALKFRVGLRGYRMQDVDAALAALARELDRRPVKRPDDPAIESTD